jgi:hypothetical protein
MISVKIYGLFCQSHSRDARTHSRLIEGFTPAMSYPQIDSICILIHLDCTRVISPGLYTCL